MRSTERLPLVLWILASLPLAAQVPPTVLSVQPALEDHDASPAEPIRIFFDRPLDPGTVTPRSVRVFGRWSGVVPGTLEMAGSDHIVVFQESADLVAVQPPSCTATLRVNNMANRAGFSGTPPTRLRLGERDFLGISGQSNSSDLLVLGARGEPGYEIPAGFVNLSLALPLILLVDGFSGAGNGRTDARGESLDWAVVPGTVPIGVRAALQAVILDSTAPTGVHLTNPETVVFVL